MRAIVQRVMKASVSINGTTVGAINKGLVILLGVKNGDKESLGPELAGPRFPFSFTPESSRGRSDDRRTGRK